MDNNVLKVKFDNVQRRIEVAKSKGENTAPLMKEKMELLQIGYKKLSKQLTEDKFEKNPKKYSILLQYLNNIKGIQSELNIPHNETDSEIQKIYSQMEQVGLAWLIRK